MSDAVWKQGLTKRLGEPAFWVVQGAVMAISAFHLAWDAGWIFENSWVPLSTAHHSSVILYLIPVSYAGLAYGWEGGVFTGLWAGAFSILNILIFSRDDFEWVIETGFSALVLGVGIALAWPVERERLQRRRAESAVSRLGALNVMALLATSAGSTVQTARTVLFHLVQMLQLDDAAFVMWRADRRDPLIEVTHTTGSPLSAIAKTRGDTTGETTVVSESTLKTTVTAGDLTANLVVDSKSENLNHPEIAIFMAAVANQLAVQIENAMLHEYEKTMMANYVKLVTEAQEEERRRLARDLHDGPAQELAILVRDLERVGVGESAGGDLHTSASAILGELRRVARDQRPSLLDDLGIGPALEWLVSEADKRTVASLTLRIEGQVRRPAPGTEVALFRIAQEALYNAERHANATNIGLVLCFQESEVELSVADDGEGFRTPDSAGEYLDSGRLGLMGMHERADLVGGSLQIESTIGSGTTVIARVPTSSGVELRRDGRPWHSL